MKAFFEKYKSYLPAAFFIGGFLFDLLTLSRIDESLQLIQQLIYLLVIGAFLVVEKMPKTESFFSVGKKSKIWSYRHEATHFLLGSLLSAYMIFYFKSSSIWNSFIFISLLAAILILNEFEKIKGLGDSIRFSLFSLCSASYFIILVPILWNYLGFLTFLFGVSFSGVFVYLYIHAISKYSQIEKKKIISHMLLPTLATHGLFVLLYIFRVLPPVPLSLEKVGIYHNIQKSGPEYQLYYDRPFWKFWQKGEQHFIAQPGDKIYCFTSIFAPAFFKDRVQMEWWLSTKNGWQKTDSVPLEISGGSEKGFRGYTFKSNYDAGDWQIRVVTSDAREIGRIYLTVEKSATPITNREWKVETY